ncbi:MAG: universal stress protein [Halobacteriaceae archaeon]
MYEHILIPTDGSEGASRGVDHGLDIAVKYGATVHVLYVVDEAHHATPALSSEELFIEKCEDVGEEILEAVVERAEEAGLEVVTTCVRGVPYQAIREYVDEHEIDLIVMGIHGQSALQRPHIGSTTDRVVRTVEVPVLPV